MGVLMFLIIVAAVVGGLALGAVVLSGLPRLRSLSSSEQRSTKLQLREAQKALRIIANGTSGNPVLEAQIALDEIDRKALES